MNPVPHPPVARVLLVDDEPMVLASLRETLRHEGHTLAVANSAEEALELARQHTFAVIVSDQQMPAMTGIELLAEMKKLHPEAARILISAVPTANLVVEAVNHAEIFRFVLKPWQREELVHAVREGIARYNRFTHDQLLLKTTTAMNETLHKLTESLQQQLDTKRNRSNQ